MKIGLYSPYLDSFGGGERYILTAAEVLSKEHGVDLFLDTHLLKLQPIVLKEKLSQYFNLQLDEVNFIQAPVGLGSSFLQRLFFLRNYDCVIYLTDGSIFYSTAKRNLLHFQVPFTNQSANGIWGKIKLTSWNLAIYNSNFTKEIIEKTWPIKGEVLYPPVDISNIKPLTKKKQILNVGRFFGFLKTKKHNEMIIAFKEIFDSKKISGWSLHLAGSAGEGDQTYIDQLRSLAKGLPVYFYPNISYKDLLKLYGESSIYWHAAGLNETDPAKMEHFGITTVEAMAAGCVPVVINKGGQVEIVEHDQSGLLWDNANDLKEMTINLINNTNKRVRLSKNAILRASLFSKEKFSQSIQKLVSK